MKNTVKNAANSVGFINSLKSAEWVAANTSIRLFGDAVLSAVCTDVAINEFENESTQSIQDELISTLTNYRKQTGLGRGLAANQIGYSKRIVVVIFDAQCEVLYNPKVVETKGSASYWECCLSSGLLLLGEVIRPASGIFEYQQADGTVATLEADPAQTRLLLHEIDHLNGVTCDQKYEPGTQRFVTGGKEEILSHPLTVISES